MTTCLADHRILVVEDEYQLARDMARHFRTMGATVIGPLPTSQEALAAVHDEALDGAVLDIRLEDGDVYQTADLLREKGVPFVFATGFASDGIPVRYAGIPVLQKPVDPSVAARALAAIARKSREQVRFVYAVSRVGSRWYWEIHSNGTLTHSGSAESSIQARLAALKAATMQQ